jgi:hypothetical protein
MKKTNPVEKAVLTILLFLFIVAKPFALFSDEAFPGNTESGTTIEINIGKKNNNTDEPFSVISSYYCKLCNVLPPLIFYAVVILLSGCFIFIITRTIKHFLISMNHLYFVPNIVVDKMDLDNKKIDQIRKNEYFYLQYTISIKIKGMLLRNLGDYPVLSWIEPPHNGDIVCELTDCCGYIKDKSKDTCFCFYTIASANPQKTVIKFKIKCEEINTAYSFNLYFDNHIHPAYSRTIKLFLNDLKRKKKNDSNSDNKKIEITGNVKLRADIK